MNFLGRAGNENNTRLEWPSSHKHNTFDTISENIFELVMQFTSYSCKLHF